MQPVPITTKVMSLNPTHGEVFSMQYYVIKCVRDFRQVICFLQVLVFSSNNKAHNHAIADILFIAVLNSITHNRCPMQNRIKILFYFISVH